MLWEVRQNGNGTSATCSLFDAVFDGSAGGLRRMLTWTWRSIAQGLPLSHGRVVMRTASHRA